MRRLWGEEILSDAEGTRGYTRLQSALAFLVVVVLPLALLYLSIVGFLWAL